jgi:ligand-binding SRPBCC domain-containing protein
MRIYWCRLFSMRIHHFHAELFLPRKPEDVFPFFADAHNLEAITPPWVKFKVLTPGPIPMRAGALIDYKLRIHGIPMKWRTEITAWEPPFRFVDEQLRGPYRLWRHTHTFEEKDGGTLCHDHVEYAVLGGAIIDRLFVRRDVEKIFEFRQQALRRIFADEAPVP